MTSQPFPTWRQKTDALRDAIAWAAQGIAGDWKFKKEATSLPDDNNAWFELRMGRILERGVPDVVSEDNIDPTTGQPDVDNPRKEIVYSAREFFVEARFFSRDQEHDAVAWLIADRARSRLRMPYVRDRFFTPVGLSVLEFTDLFSMPNPNKVVMDRYESEALFEMQYFTILAEADNAAVGTWIETVELTSNLKNAGGVPLDPKLQLDKEVLP